MATLLWDQLRLDEFWFAALPPSREGTNWLNILKTLVTPPAKERPGDWTQHPDYFVAKEALAKDDAASAREAFSRVLAERPQQLDARAGLAEDVAELAGQLGLDTAGQDAEDDASAGGSKEKA